MKLIRNFALGAAIFGAGLACEPAANNTAGNSNAANVANANANAAKPIAAVPTKEVLFALEKQGWEGWKNRDPKAFESMLSEKYVGFGPAGRINKAASIKGMTEQKCEIKSYSLTDEQMTMVGADVAVLSFKAAQDGVCDGKRVPAAVWSAAIYAREGDAWKSVYYSEAAVPDPKAPPVKPAASAPAAATSPDAAKPDADPLFAMEKKAWEAWRTKDAKTFEDAMDPNFFWIAENGRTDRANIIKAWTTDNKCEVKTTALSEPNTVSLSPDVSLLTFKGGGDGTCEGMPLKTQWYASLYKKTGDSWKSAFGTYVP